MPVAGITARGDRSLGTGRLDRSGGLRDNKPAGGTDTAGVSKGRELQLTAFLFMSHPKVGGRGITSWELLRSGGGITMDRVKSTGMADLTLQKFERCQEGLMQSNVEQNCIDSNALLIDVRKDSIACHDPGRSAQMARVSCASSHWLDPVGTASRIRPLVVTNEGERDLARPRRHGLLLNQEDQR